MLIPVLKLFHNLWEIAHLQKSRKVQNLISCLFFNALKMNSKISKTALWEICKKFWKVSEFHFTLQPSIEVFSLEKMNSKENLLRSIFTSVTHLISSIPEWPEIFFRIEEKTRKFSNYRCIYSIHINTSYFNAPNFRLKKCLIILFILTRLDLQTPICYNLHARFLIDNSIEMALKDFSYVETNLVQNFKSII